MVSQYNYKSPKGEVNSGIPIVETAGYIPAKIQIENMILAGQRLSDYRREMYDFGYDEPDDETFDDPTRHPNFDMADASAYMRRLRAQTLATESSKNVEEASVSDKEVKNVIKQGQAEKMASEADIAVSGNEGGTR